MNIAGIEEKGFMYDIQKQHNQMAEEYYSRQIADILPFAIREAVQEELSKMNVTVEMNGE